jgi:hypothetical protein
LRLGGPIRIRTEEEPKRGVLTAITEIFANLDRRVAVLAGLGVSVGLLLGYHSKKSDVVAAKPPRHSEAAAVATTYAIEKPSTPVNQPQSSTVAANSSIGRPSESFESTSLSALKVPVTNALVQLTTTPAGATYTVYPGVIASKTAPAAEPMRSGTSPGSIEDLPPGRYTFFFHNEGYPDDRAEVSVSAGETVPVDYTFPHGTATITSAPNNAEIFLGTRSLGNTPLTVDLPLGKLKLVARLPDMPERSQTVAIGPSPAATVNFEMKGHHSNRVKPKPTPSALDKLGQSLKHVFSPKQPSPAPRKKN